MLVIVDYGMGNLHSVKNMLKYLGYDSIISGKKEDIMQADKLILPGVGNFGSAMQIIEEMRLKDVLDQKVLEERTPILGICLGMQLLMGCSEEGNCEGLNWIPGNVKKFCFSQETDMKIPHMGWDYIHVDQECKLLQGVDADSRYYFVHSYFVECEEREHAAATTEYGIIFDSVVKKDNIMGTQFHPEKSHRFGMNILKNFMEI